MKLSEFFAQKARPVDELRKINPKVNVDAAVETVSKVLEVVDDGHIYDITEYDDEAVGLFLYCLTLVIDLHRPKKLAKHTELSAQKERGRRIQDQLDAIYKIMDFRDGDGSVFATIDRNEFCFGLGLLVYKPRVLDQGAWGLCGPASVLISVIKQMPLAFANGAMLLFQTGKGRLGSINVVAPPEIRAYSHANYDQSKRWIRAADWVLLASLRAAPESMIDLGVFKDIANYTTPKLLASWLTSAGYTHVTDCTIEPKTMTPQTLQFATAHVKIDSFHESGWTAPPLAPGAVYTDQTARGNAIQHLQQMAAEIQQKRIVIMYAYGNLAHKHYQQSADKRPNVTSAQFAPIGQVDWHNLHWTLMKSVQVANDTVYANLYTWGERGKQSVAIPLKSFLKHYAGYVAGSP